MTLKYGFYQFLHWKRPTYDEVGARVGEGFVYMVWRLRVTRFQNILVGLLNQ